MIPASVAIPTTPNLDDGRQVRGLQIAAMSPLRTDQLGYRVQSQSGDGAYLVNLEYGVYCTCPDFDKTGKACKHIYAVGFALKREDLEDAPVAETGKLRGWSVYNRAQINEGQWFKSLLRGLCDTVPMPPQTGRGRPRLPISDMLYGMGLKVYSNRSTRRAQTESRNAVEAGMMDVEPCFGTMIRYFEREEMTPVLRQLIQDSALPLRDLEVDFAIDGSGFSTTNYQRWFDHKWGKPKKEAQWVKLHIMCGVQTNIVTAAEATATLTADAPYLPDFVEITKRNFNIREVSGDMAYSSIKNLHAIDDAGGTPYIPFKKSSGPNKDPLWTKMYHHFTLQEVEFNKHYHKRSNVETCFHMMKTKFGDSVKSKSDTAMVNETLLKVLCHNICVLVNAMHTLGVAPAFSVN